MDGDKRIKILAEHLIWAINQAYNSSELIQEALHQIEKEGYRVDILLAAFTRFDKTGSPEPASEHVALFSQDGDEHPAQQDSAEDQDEEPFEEEDSDPNSPLSAELNEFDRTFLKIIKVGLMDS